MTDTQKVTNYPLSEIPSFVIQSKLMDVSPEELEYQCQKLREENHQLQLRILGVNELARLLQDRNELIGVLKDRNKRLEVSVVRLENRCANFERQIKTQKNGSMPSMKQGYSPFIPGPSRQILEGLMQENSELKKTVNNLQKKGPSGYLEAVKTTQLEEFIEQQKMEIDQLHKQINSLTSTGMEEEPSSLGGGGGGMSLPTNVTETGPLKRQMLKMQQMMTVKDRFCSLLSQQVSELQKKLNRMQNDSVDSGDTKMNSEESKSVSTENMPITETADPGEIGGIHAPRSTNKEELSQYKRHLEEIQTSLDSERKGKLDLLQKMSELEGNVRSLSGDKEEIQEKFETISQLYSTLLSDNSDFRQEVDSLKLKLKNMAGRRQESSSGEGGTNGRLEKQISDLQMTMDKQVQDYNKELKAKEMDLSSTRIELEESNYRYMLTDSELSKCQNELKQKDSELFDLNDRVKELTEDNDTMQSIHYQQNMKIMDLESDIKKYHAINPTRSLPSFIIKTGGAPSLIPSATHGQDIAMKDSPFKGPPLVSRDVRDPPKPSGLNLQQQKHMAPIPGTHRVHSPGPVYSNRGQIGGQPPMTSHSHPSSSAHQTAVTPLSNYPMGSGGRVGPGGSNTSPIPMMTQLGSGHPNRPNLSPYRPTSANQLTNPFGPPPIPPRTTTTGGGGGGAGGGGLGGAIHGPFGTGRVNNTMYSQVPPSSTMHPGRGGGGGGGNYPVYTTPAAIFGPPLPRQSQYPRPEGTYYQSDIRDRHSGSSSPHPPHPHDNVPGHIPQQFGSGGASGQPPPSHGDGGGGGGGGGQPPPSFY